MHPFHPCKQAKYGSTGLAIDAVQVKTTSEMLEKCVDHKCGETTKRENGMENFNR